MKKNKAKTSKNYHNKRKLSKTTVVTKHNDYKNVMTIDSKHGDVRQYEFNMSSHKQHSNDSLNLNRSKAYRQSTSRNSGKFREIAYLLDYTRSKTKRSLTY